MVDAPFAAEMSLGAEGSDEVLEGAALLELQGRELVDEEGVGEVVENLSEMGAAKSRSERVAQSRGKAAREVWR